MKENKKLVHAKNIKYINIDIYVCFGTNTWIVCCVYTICECAHNNAHQLLQFDSSMMVDQASVGYIRPFECAIPENSNFSASFSRVSSKLYPSDFSREMEYVMLEIIEPVYCNIIPFSWIFFSFQKFIKSFVFCFFLFFTFEFSSLVNVLALC